MEKFEDLIKEGQKFSSEYAIDDVIGVSNHLPMCLFARFRLGASDTQLQEFYDSYITKLEVKNTALFSSFDWESSLGKHQYNSEYLNFFKYKYQELGKEKLLSSFLPILFAGVGGGAFHPLIRLGYALEMNNADEIVEALASWGMAFLPVNISNRPKKEGSIEEALEKLSQLKFNSSDFQVAGVFNRMENAGKNPLYQQNMKTPITLKTDDFAKFGLRIFLSKQSFANIHLVTASHALRHVEPYLGNKEKSLESFWRAFSATYVSEGTPDINSISETELLPWEDLFSKAVESNNDHWCKFVYTCSEEEKFYRDSNYRMAASLLLLASN